MVRTLVERAINDVMGGEAVATVYVVGQDKTDVLKAGYDYAKELERGAPGAGWTVKFNDEFHQLRFERTG